MQHDPPDRCVCFTKQLGQVFYVVQSFFLLELSVDNILFQFLLDRDQALWMELSEVLHSLLNDIVAECFNRGWERAPVSLKIA